MYQLKYFFRPNNCILTLSILILFFTLFSSAVLFGQTFTKITTGDIVNDGGYSYGSSWGDYDNDGYVDLFVANYSQNNFLYRNNSDGTFNKITTLNIVNDGGFSFIGNWGDYDNDSDLDLFVSNDNQNNFLYSNNGNGSFTQITSGDVVDVDSKSWCCCWGDYDNDGDLDLFVANYDQNNFLYRNNGDGTFFRVTTGDIVNERSLSRGCSWGDYDNDGDLDLFVANYNQNNFLYRNNGDGTFTKITEGIIVNDIGYSKGGSWGDYDNDGDLDLFVTNDVDQNNSLYSNNGDGTFTKITTGNIVNDGGKSYSSSWSDYDNDGDLDLFVTNDDNQNNFLYSSNGDGTFNKIITGSLVNDGGLSCSGAWCDHDNDGDLDLFVANWDQNNFLYLNNGNNNNWINIKCVGTTSNTSAIGAKVKIKAIINSIPVWQLQEISGQTGFACQNSLNAEFGLGDATFIDSVKIEWPSGIVQILTDISVNQFLLVTEPVIYLDVSIVDAQPGQIVLVPVNVQFPLNFSFSSAEINIGGYLSNLDFIEVITDSSLAGDAGWIYQANETDSLSIIWFAGAEEISGRGIFFWLKFLVLDTDLEFVPITLESALFNTGELPVELTTGGINILRPNYGDVDLNGKIQAFDAAMILKYLVGYIDLSLQQLMNANVSLDTTISALDATLILQYGVGLIDSLPYRGSRELFIAAGDITMKDKEIQSGKSVDIPLILSNGDNILSFEGKIVYNPEHLILNNIVWSELLDNFIVDINDDDGEILVAGAGTSFDRKADGLFATLQFSVSDYFDDDETMVSLQRLRWNEGAIMEDVASTTLSNVSSVKEKGSEIPDKYTLNQNYPNPFNPTTTITYALKQSSPVQLLIYDEMARLVRIVVNTTQTAGRYSVVWDGRNEKGELVASGAYFYTLKVDQNVLFTQRMIMIK